MKFPPPSASEIDAVERELGYKLPASLLNVYATHGNGGFGPDYGMLGLGSGHVTDLGDTAISLYRAFRTADPEAPTHVWPQGLLPILHIGCAVHYCVDLVTPQNQVIKFDPKVTRQATVGAVHSR